MSLTTIGLGLLALIVLALLALLSQSATLAQESRDHYADQSFDPTHGRENGGD
jgi:hypothetical protein